MKPVELTTASPLPDAAVAPLDDEIKRVAEEAMQMVLQYVEADELDEAQTLCRAILDMAPGHARAQHQLGLLARQAGHLPEAAAYLLGALQAAPDEESHWLAYIDVLLTARELTAAAETIALARRNGLRGAAFDALGKRLARAERGTPSRKEVDALSALLLERRLDEAMQAAHAMTVDCPHDAFGWQSLSAVFYMRGQIAPALEAMSKALECTPDSAKVLSNVGLLLKESRRHEQAIDHLKRALELDPTLFDAHVNLAACLLNINCFAEAEASARAAAGIDPKNALAWNNVAIAMASQGRFVGAVDAYRRALALDPANARVHSNMLFSMSQMDGIDADALFAEHVRYGEQVEAPLRKHWRAHANERDPQRPLRIGFLSGDLRHHAVTSFVEPIFARMAGRPGLSLHAYHNHLVTDHVSQRLQGYMAQWTEVVGMDDDTLAQRIRDDGIDILVDLSGHTALNRLPVLARKPAPVQVTWIGYPGTTGLESVDYYLTERALLPPGQFDHQFTEKLVYLPLSAPFQPELDAAPVNRLPALDNGYITFGSFNRISKIGREVVATWARLLRALPDARMLVGGVPENSSAGQLLEWLAEEGIDAARIDLHNRTGLLDYLALHNRIDILLDSFPYSGGTTTVHALWMGVPTLTVAGDTAAGRQTACCLEHTGLQHFICRDADDFERRGLAICADLDALAQIRARLRGTFEMPSSDSMTWVVDLVEQAFRTMWRRWCDGLPAASFEVTAPEAEPAAELSAESAASAPAPLPAQAPIYVTQPEMPPLADFVASLEQIWNSKYLTNGGPFHQQLEAALCAYLGVEHICLFANGTLALMTALQALDISGEVITTPYSFVATTHALAWIGLKPVFVDVDPTTFNLDPDKIEAAITPHTRAIMPVHCYGNPCDVERIAAIARKHGLKVVYDAAHAFGVRQDGTSILHHGDLSVLSFHATKVFNTLEGGAIVCRDAAMKQKIDRLKNFGIVDEATIAAVGINGKMNEISAAYGLLQLKGVDAAIEKRGRVVARYRELLGNVPGIAWVPALGDAPNFSYFPILVQDGYPLTRDALYQKLREAGIHARRYFFPLISDLPMYSGLPSAAADNLPVAVGAARQVLCLPLYPALDEPDIERIAGIVRAGVRES